MHAETHLDQSIAGRFKYAIVLTAATLVAELAGGMWTNSLALLSDAAHVFLDLFALLLSLGAIKLASFPSSDTRTFGWHRTEVFASLINGTTVFVIAGIICYEAFGRMVRPEEIKSLPMMIIAAVGLAMNVFAAGALHGHSHDDLNVRSAFLHMIGDAAASVGVIVGGIIMYFSNWYILDAIISVGIGFVIFWGSWRVIREAVHILLEGVPKGVDVNQVSAAIKEVEGVEEVHHVNIWTICSHIIALSGHIVVPASFKGEHGKMLRKIEERLFERFHISHTTLQVESVRCTDAQGIKQFRHRPRASSLAQAHAHPHHHPHGTCGHDHHHDHHH
ncbi:cation diffusion facilitator family transporter [Geomonas sp. Red32]|uniref:cation diffusion facilitator family transporter n=1 Tax=Geomonas sp. Red32 TaxID=2912856 RepID=UPI00202D0914|nr:cation diffusion facilitator family transporter [Geomonas sp. Red32]MCM0081223.1 cation diffusion facilitator family transporter [Geomonas sp. Red32]